MTRFEEIVGQAPAIDLLRRMLRSGRIPHALLFHGPEGVGKATTARAFAAVLLCGAQPEGPCGRCPSCAALSAGTHPDLMQVGLLAKTPTSSRARATDGGASTDPEELKKQIVVDQIRELAHMASQTPRMGARRAFIIDPADAMNASAQNALLKTLEEPPGRSVLVLVASRPHLLLPTVRSRSFALGFAALRTSDLAEILRKNGDDDDEALVRASLAEGRPGRAISLDVDELSRRRDEVLRMIEGLVPPGARLEALPSMAAALAGKTEANLVEGLDLLIGLLRDVGRCAIDCSAEGLLHGDLVHRLEPLGRRLGRRRAAELIGMVERRRSELRVNVNRTLVAETLLAAVAGGPTA